eukprot:SAG11_NODE_1706_length_4412_cov_3.163691_2_plen_293_part_00
MLHLLLLLDLLSGASSQLGPFTSPTCDMAMLPARITHLNAACCIAPGDGTARADCDGSCGVECVGQILPLLQDCRDVLNKHYDGDDGYEDGESRPLTDAYNECLAIPVAELIDDLAALQESGRCPPEQLDGVALSELKGVDECTDVWEEGRCGLMLDTGLMTCEHDFCNSVPTRENPCDLAGHCDETCELCEDPNGHRRQLALKLLNEHARQLQIGFGQHVLQCDPASFAVQVGLVDEACCDEGHTACDDSGSPTECDAKCAVVYNRCERISMQLLQFPFNYRAVVDCLIGA